MKAPLIAIVGLLASATALHAVRAERAERISVTNTTGVSVVHASILSGRLVRSYRLYVPAHLPAHPALVVVLHGGFGSGDGAAKQTGFDAVARRHHFLVLYPDGFARSWNAITCCGLAARLDVDDVGFVARLIARMRAQYRVDSRRVYVTGISNGGLLAYLVACRLADEVAAIGPVSATMDFDGCAPSRPVSVLHIHGTADENIPYAGGVGSKGVEKIDWRAVPDTISSWRTLDGCGTETEQTRGVLTTSVSRCKDGTAVELITIAGGGHSWPGGTRRSTLLDPPSTALDASETLWRFFAAHPRRTGRR